MNNINKLIEKERKRKIKRVAKELKLFRTQKNWNDTIYAIDEVSESEELRNQKDKQQQEMIMLQQHQHQIEDKLFDDLLKAQRMADDQIQDFECDIFKLSNIEQQVWHQTQTSQNTYREKEFFNKLSFENDLERLRLIADKIKQDKSSQIKWQALNSQFFISMEKGSLLSIDGEPETTKHWRIYDEFFEKTCNFKYPNLFKQDFNTHISKIDQYFLIYRRALLNYMAFYKDYGQWPTKENYKGVFVLTKKVQLRVRFEYKLAFPCLPQDWVSFKNLN